MMERLITETQAAIRGSLLQVADEYDRIVSENNALLFELRRLQDLMKTRQGDTSRPSPSQFVPLKTNGERPPSHILSDDLVSLEIMDERSCLTRKLRSAPKDLHPTAHLASKKPCVETGDPASLFMELTEVTESSYAPVNSITSAELFQGMPPNLDSEYGIVQRESYQLSAASDEERSGDSAAFASAPQGDADKNHDGSTGSSSTTSTPSSRRASLLPDDCLFPKWFDPGATVEHWDNMDAAIIKRGSAVMGGRLSTMFQEDLEDQRDMCVMPPVGKVRMSWDFIAFLCLLWELWVTPFDLVFLDGVEAPQSLAIISYGITGFFFVDIFLNFSTGYIIGDKTIMCRRMILRNYLQFWFWVDFVATVPWEIILEALGGGVFSMARMGKGAKILKSLRYLKLVRAARLMKTMRQAGMLMKHFQILAPLRIIFGPLKVGMFLCCFSHIHGCFWAILQPDWVNVDTMGEAVRNYYQSFWWAFTMVTLGVQYRYVDNPGVWTFEMIISGERLMLIVLLMKRVLLAAFQFLDDVRKEAAKEDVLAYLRGHNVHFPTQIAVLFSLNDTGEARKRQRKVNELLDNELPRELVRTINEELWGKRLMSLGIIARVAEWMPEFVTEVSQGVIEEVYPSRTIILKLGESALVAYCIIYGKLVALKNPMFGQIPPFTERMWVGENALVSTVLRCSATIVSQVITSLMVVRGEFFQQLISRLGMMQEYQAFCSAQLWKGLCGRCGQLGSHFSDTCTYTVPTAKTRASEVKKRISQQGAGRMTHKISEAGNGRKSVHDTANDQVGRDLLRFLGDNGLQWLRLLLRDMGILTLDDLEQADIVDLCKRLQVERDISEDDLKAIAPENIREYREMNALKTKRTLFHEVSRLHHLMFLSHYKLEAGTEAALMRTELEEAIAQDAGSLGHSFDEPVFLDSENLNSLEDLTQRVINTHNLVLLLTKNVLSRPWVLVEILTARREGVRILLVNVSKPGGSFEFPDDAFYENLRDGHFLDQDAMDVLSRCGCYAAELEEALRAVFQQIAIPYSPHKAKSIRRAEMQSLLKQCKLKTEGSRKTTEPARKSREGSRSMTCEDVAGFQLSKNSHKLSTRSSNQPHSVEDNLRRSFGTARSRTSDLGGIPERR